MTSLFQVLRELQHCAAKARTELDAATVTNESARAHLHLTLEHIERRIGKAVLLYGSLGEDA